MLQVSCTTPRWCVCVAGCEGGVFVLQVVKVMCLCCRFPIPPQGGVCPQGAGGWRLAALHGQQGACAPGR